MAELVAFGPVLLPKWIALMVLTAAFPMWLGLMSILTLAPRPEVAEAPRRDGRRVPDGGPDPQSQP